ncbi:MAG: GNAT family N-acetyltransferase [Arcobacter butzleri]|jgi:ribosomal-protein-alanine N-acetyltransferase|nr:GNAT family N-acetyltransferase [Arcobacteraceae bacterium]MDY0364862.1 GNAT family N-acetyltransferase [Arcobacteraceae bacterium]NLO17095.1 GNAT family N-acetyltransferase [Aliarcobacter butzleri]
MIRVANIDDLKNLLELESRVFSKYDYPINKKSFIYHIKKEHIIVVGDKNHIYGYILFFDYKKSIRVYSLAIDIPFTNQGYGTKLMEYLIKFAKKSKKAITLEVKIDNYNAIFFYEKFNFKKSIILNNYYLDGKDGIKMKADYFLDNLS